MHIKVVLPIICFVLWVVLHVFIEEFEETPRAQQQQRQRQLRESIQKRFWTGFHDRNLTLIGEILRYKHLPELQPTPLALLANEKDETQEMLTMAYTLLRHSSIDPNGDCDADHPLTLALRNRHFELVSLLMSDARTIREAYAARLPCEVLDSLPPSLALIVGPQTRSCFSSRKLALREEHSALVDCAKRKARSQGTQKVPTARNEASSSASTGSARPDHGVDGKSGKPNEEAAPGAGVITGSKAQYDWNNPFVDPPPGVIPRGDHVVVNPKSFGSLLEALAFYFLRMPWPGVYSVVATAMLTVFYIFVAVVLLAVFLK